VIPLSKPIQSHPSNRRRISRSPKNYGRKNLLVAMLATLLMVGCGEEAIDLDDPGTRKKIAAEQSGACPGSD
jgi:hypothetical protein